MASDVPSIDVVRFGDEYERVAPLYGMGPAELQERDGKGEAVQRWFVTIEGRAVGAVHLRLRPDQRLFLTFKGDRDEALPPLIRAVRDAIFVPIFTTVDLADIGRVEALVDCGFEVETVGERFSVRFSDALAMVHRAWVPSAYRIESVAEVDERAALALDNDIRNLVPGTEGWAGSPDWFHDELTSPEFDPDTYLIAVERSTGECVGLLRIWRNATGPRLGLLGVLPDHRRGPLAAAMLKQGLGVASQWGHDSFMTETSPCNTHTYPRLERLAADRLGQFAQMRRQPDPQNR